MKMISRKAIRCLFAFLPFCTLPFSQVGVVPSKKHAQLTEATDEKFKVGDVWRYHTRDKEDDSTLTVLRIEEEPTMGIIVHIAVDHVRLKSCRSGYEPHEIPHMPFVRKALADSVTERIESPPKRDHDWKPGYQEWRAAFENQQAGVYTISVADAVATAEKTYNQGLGCS